MTYPRSHLVDPDADGLYHCTSRCVRRGWLCGEDPVSGQSYGHRKEWVESRIVLLSEIFTVDLYAYAVMSNHYHVVVEVKPSEARELSDHDVARRWLRLSRKRRGETEEGRVERLLGNPTRIVELRTRLGSLSWFMKYLNEPIARAANREDDCKGRVWEGRFKSIALLDELALVGCMAYVDLNPVRAKITKDPESAPHTSIKRRVASSECAARPLVPLEAIGLTAAGYLELLAWTAAADGGGPLNERVAPPAVLQRLGDSPAGWLTKLKAHRFKYRAYGAVDKLGQYAESLGQRWIKGIREQHSNHTS